MNWWVFHAQQLDTALAAREAKRQQEGATQAEAKAESALIYAFLVANLDTMGGKR